MVRHTISARPPGCALHASWPAAHLTHRRKGLAVCGHSRGEQGGESLSLGGTLGWAAGGGAGGAGQHSNVNLRGSSCEAGRCQCCLHSRVSIQSSPEGVDNTPPAGMGGVSRRSGQLGRAGRQAGTRTGAGSGWGQAAGTTPPAGPSTSNTPPPAPQPSPDSFHGWQCRLALYANGSLPSAAVGRASGSTNLKDANKLTKVGWAWWPARGCLAGPVPRTALLTGLCSAATPFGH
jgi:hypothetical protein